MAGRNFLQKQKENQPNQIRIDAVVAPVHARALMLPWLEVKIKLVLCKDNKKVTYQVVALDLCKGLFAGGKFSSSQKIGKAEGWAWTGIY